MPTVLCWVQSDPTNPCAFGCFFFRGSKFASVDVSDSDGYQTLATIGAERWHRLVTGENCWMLSLPGMSYVKRTNAYL